jgi:TonB family protein
VIATPITGVGIIVKIAIALVIVSGFALFATGPSGLPDKIPPCAAMPDEASYYPDNMIRPKYPKDALRNGAAGTVELRAVIAPDGRTQDVSVLSGEPAFRPAAMEAVRKWRFHPQMKQGHPVQAAYKIEIRFNPQLREANSSVELESPPDVRVTSEPGVVAPKALYKPDPEFSEEARKAAHQGNVGIALVVGTDGLPRDLKITCSSVPENNENALAAVRLWKFDPATKEGKPVAVPIELEVSFKLH